MPSRVVGSLLVAVVAQAMACGSPSVHPGSLDANGIDINFPDLPPPSDIPVTADVNDAADVLAPMITLGAGTDVANAVQRAALGFQAGFPDGQIGALMNGSTWTFFGSAYSNGNCSATPNQQGAYRLGGTPVALTNAYGCGALLTDDTSGVPFQSGSLVGLYDRDYTGGGPVARITNPSTGAEAIILLYRGEFYWGAECANELPCFYSTLGLAFSTDGGMTFTRLGEVIQPYATREQGMSSRTADVGSGTLVLGDVNGNPVSDRAAPSPENSYFYVFYTDQDAGIGCSGLCVAVARASLADVAATVFTNPGGVTTLFHKYKQGTWTQLGVSGDPNDAINSGSFSPIVSSGLAPTVLYDRAINRFIMAVVQPTTTGSDIVFHVGDSLLNWGDVETSASVHEAGNFLTDPTLLGETGDPSVGDTLPWLMYVSGPTDNIEWTAAILRTHVLQVE